MDNMVEARVGVTEPGTPPPGWYRRPWFAHRGSRSLARLVQALNASMPVHLVGPIPLG